MTKASKNNSAQTTPAKTKASPAARKTKPRETKRSQLIRMLQAAKGTDIAQISKKLGWQKHTTRAALTGLRKAGITIERSVSDGGRASVYRIVAEPNAEPAR